MAKEIYLYSSIYDWTAEQFNRELGSVEGDADIRLRTDGGYTDAGSAMLMALNSFKGKKNGFVDGDVSSMGAEMLLFMDYVEMNEFARIMFHKAAYPSWYEPTPEQQKRLKEDNELYKSKIKQKIGGNGEKAEAIIEKIYESDVRNDVWLNAKEALEIGLIDKIVTIDVKVASLAESSYAVMKKQAEKHEQILRQQYESNRSNIQTVESNKNEEPMSITKEDLDKAVASARAEGYAEGQENENQRIQAWAAFQEVDPTSFTEAVKDKSKMVTAAVMAEMTVKLAKANVVEGHKNDNSEDQDLPKDKKTAEELAAEKDQKTANDLFAEYETKKD